DDDVCGLRLQEQPRRWCPAGTGSTIEGPIDLLVEQDLVDALRCQLFLGIGWMSGLNQRQLDATRYLLRARVRRETGAQEFGDHVLEALVLLNCSKLDRSHEFFRQFKRRLLHRPILPASHKSGDG